MSTRSELRTRRRGEIRNPKAEGRKKSEARNPKLAEPEPKWDKASPSAEVTTSRNTGPSRAAVPMFLHTQVLINVRSCRTKVCPKETQEDVACNKILKPFCMQFRKDEAKARNFPVLAGVLNIKAVGFVLVSDFGFRTSFGLRPSDFGFPVAVSRSHDFLQNAGRLRAFLGGRQHAGFGAHGMGQPGAAIYAG